MLELITFKQASEKNIQNYSPFCSKVETFLKLAKIEHKHTEFNGALKKFPNGKLPVIIHKEKMIPDSYFIFKYLIKELKLDIDDHLSELDLSQARAYTSMIEEHLYWALVCERWVEDKNWNRLKQVFLKGIPKPIGFIVGNMIRKITIKNCIGQGMGRFSDDERFEISKELVRSLSHFLADKKYAFGDKISSYDAIFYATLSNIIYSDFSPRLQNEALKYENLEQYCQRVKSLI